MAKDVSTTRVVLQCKKCGSKETIQRRASEKKKSGCIEHLWCVNCCEITEHAEIGEE